MPETQTSLARKIERLRRQANEMRRRDPLSAFFRFDLDHPVRSAQSVDGRGRRILEHIDRLDVVGIDVRRGRIDGKRYAIQDNEWFVVALDRVYPSNHDAPVDDLHTRHAPRSISAMVAVGFSSRISATSRVVTAPVDASFSESPSALPFCAPPEAAHPPTPKAPVMSRTSTAFILIAMIPPRI